MLVRFVETHVLVADLDSVLRHKTKNSQDFHPSGIGALLASLTALAERVPLGCLLQRVPQVYHQIDLYGSQAVGLDEVLDLLGVAEQAGAFGVRQDDAAFGGQSGGKARSSMGEPKQPR
ncbi:hypothetical protein BS329_35395 [Amycolatopsis coloradensis]|uniref:Uncharacterized protein n=1 Tax=Amycolatopsis coloradensis TaxID=76021 RepID=A0A1R0KH92_9PSEU|nr:hypothetical protein BS329_35395 [Amycolatopsis coloradensis]